MNIKWVLLLINIGLGYSANLLEIPNEIMEMILVHLGVPDVITLRQVHRSFKGFKLTEKQLEEILNDKKTYSNISLFKFLAGNVKSEKFELQFYLKMIDYCKEQEYYIWLSENFQFNPQKQDSYAAKYACDVGNQHFVNAALLSTDKVDIAAILHIACSWGRGEIIRLCLSQPSEIQEDDLKRCILKLEQNGHYQETFLIKSELQKQSTAK